MCKSTEAAKLPNPPPANTKLHRNSNVELVFASLKPNISMVRVNSNGTVNVVLNSVMDNTDLEE
jgi:hypothetical protein